MPSPAPLSMDEALSPAWLSWALSQKGEPVTVKSIDIVEELGPSATKVRFVADFGETPPATIPSHLCLKGIFKPEVQYYLSTGTQVAEIGYFRDVAPNVTVNSPRAHYAGLDPDTLAGIIITDDLVPLGAEFLTAMSPYTPEQARGSLEQLARLHGGTWGRQVDHYPWAKVRITDLVDFKHVPPAQLTELLHGKRGEPLPEWARSGERLNEAMRQLAKLADTSEPCLIHGDAHAGNVYSDASGIGLLDWQVLQRGHWSIDVGYHISAALDTEDRRASEQDLLRHYLDRLKAHGGNPPAWDEAWTQYRQAIAYGFFMWAITLRVDPPIIERFVQRMGTAIVDHNTYDLLGV